MGLLVCLTGYRCWIPYTTRNIDFVLEHFELLLYVDAHEHSLGARRAKLSL